MESVIEQGRPGQKCVAISPSDTVNFTDGACRAIWVGGAGNLSIVPPQGSAISIVGATAGSVVPISAIRVDAGGTTATSLVAIY